MQAADHNYLGRNPGETFDKAQAPDLLAEFDEYGTELHKDARVWKVYVNEADKHDTELVNGWNESIDVILVFAALFSAISTAFLIESTKLLQPDPAEQSSQTLLAISQTLSAIANGTQSPGSIPLPPGDPEEFIPSRTAICVNVLWYLSLGLSLATSFIAILAKDWCHSFMSGRTGHSHSQMCRRQRKWDMIEKWKMSELLTLLPSLIHIALLLFSVGLCIYLFDVHALVAIPVFCATGAAIGFYLWSSIAAAKIDHFPYPTIISRVCRADIVLRTGRGTFVFLSRCGSHPALRNIYQAALLLAFTVAWVLRKFLYVPAVPCELIGLLEEPLDKCDAYLAQSPPRLRVVAIALCKSARYLIWYPAKVASRWLRKVYRFFEPVEDSLKYRLSKASWGLERKEREPQTAAQASDGGTDQSDVTSLALSWLITNCEVPQSVDIALQSIAGATSRIPRQPLLDCHATLEILRRLASSNLYKGPDARTNTVISLYLRALTRLGGTAGPAAGSGRLRDEVELEGLIWDVHLESEKRVAASIVSGSFDPTQANLDALRIGNSAASTALKLLGSDSQKTNVDIDKALGSIVAQLEAHVCQSEPLHGAALVSLVNAVTLLLPFAPDASTAMSLGSLCVRMIGSHLDTSKPSDLLLANLAVICVSTLRESTDPELSGTWNSRFLLQSVVRRLAECYSDDTSILRMRSMFGLDALATYPEAFGFSTFDLDVRDSMMNIAASSVQFLNRSTLAWYLGRMGAHTPKADVLKSLSVLRGPLSLLPVESSSISLSFLILGPIRELWNYKINFVDDEWAKLASNSRFPTLSGTLTQYVEQSDFISYLESMIDKGNHSAKFVALGQLWLLFTVYLGACSDLSGERERLGVQLKRYKQSHPESEHVRHTHIGDQLVHVWGFGLYSGPLGGWPARLMECVFQSLNSPITVGVYNVLQEYNVPHDLRGLSSFTAWRPHSIETETGDGPRAVNSTHVAANDEHPSSNDISTQEMGGAAAGDETDDRGVGKHMSPGDSQRATRESIWSENPAHEMPDAEKVVEGEWEFAGDPTDPEEQGRADTGSRTDYPTIELGGTGRGTDVEPHISIDLHASETVSK